MKINRSSPFILNINPGTIIFYGFSFLIYMQVNYFRTRSLFHSDSED